jgi:competence protein ComGC
LGVIRLDRIPVLNSLSLTRAMKTAFTKPLKRSRRLDGKGFTLLDLLVVLSVIAVLIILQLPVLAAGKSQSKIGMCASNVRQLALACQIYANDNGERLPV